jgi:predicted TIM-barrel fold metal-dependent hydrolase
MIIDFHSHFYPREYLDRLAQRSEIPKVVRDDLGDRFVIFADEEHVAGAARPIGDQFFRLERKLEFMDEHGIDRAVISIGNPWVDFLAGDEAVTWALRLNDEIEAACAAQSRFLGLGVVPVDSTEAACHVARRIQSTSHVRGLIMGTRPGQRHLDDDALEPVWSVVEECNLPIFIHPHYIVGADWMSGYGHAPLLALGFTFETTTAVTRLILGGVLERHPRLRFVLAHTGGTLPFLAGRLDACTKVDERARRNLRKPFSEYLRMMYFDGVAYHAPAIRCALELVGPERIVFGTDHPFGIADAEACMSAIRQVAGLDQDAAAMLGANAEQLLLRPRA